jgi:hypothetical protein
LLSVTKETDTFEKGDLPVLFYDVADNLFFGSPLDYALAGVPTGSPFFDPALPSISSPFLNSLESVLDPASSDFDSKAHLFLTFSPAANLDQITSAFTISGESGAIDSEFVADIPESSTWAMMLLGFAGLAFIGYRQTRERPSRRRRDGCGAGWANASSQLRRGDAEDAASRAAISCGPSLWRNWRRRHSEIHASTTRPISAASWTRRAGWPG